MGDIQIVWHKRDLRTTDHDPLQHAAKCGQVLPLYIHEPLVIQADDFAAQHSGFIRESLDDLRLQYERQDGQLVERLGDAVKVFEQLWQELKFTHIWAYQETGVRRTFERDLAVHRWAKSRGVKFLELTQNGVLRGSAYKKHGFDFHRYFDKVLKSASKAAPMGCYVTAPVGCVDPKDVPVGQGVDKPLRQKGGRAQAESQMAGFFVQEKLIAYPSSISSPLSAEAGCSRMSPYLEYGIVSVRELADQLSRAAEDAMESGNKELADRMSSALKFFVERMYWRSSYMQNFENNCDIETVPQHPLMLRARQEEFNEQHFKAWKDGKTGIPMIDAAMRMLKAHGWINMRARGMLISFAVNELWLHWREPGLFLAKEFLDYCPSIHWCQMQIHGGTASGIDPLTYNPIKQAQDHDPRGVFIKRWVPELGEQEPELLHEPWKQPRLLASRGVYLGETYPFPVVPQAAAHDAARQAISAMREGRPVPQLAYIRERNRALQAQHQGGLF